MEKMLVYKQASEGEGERELLVKNVDHKNLNNHTTFQSSPPQN